jgi:hypothetical protein
MPLVPASANYSAQMEALVEEREGLALGALIGFVFSDKNLDLRGEKTADGGAASGSEDFGLSQGLLAKAKGDVLLGGGAHARIIRDTRNLREAILAAGSVQAHGDSC